MGIQNTTASRKKHAYSDIIVKQYSIVHTSCPIPRACVQFSCGKCSANRVRAWSICCLRVLFSVASAHLPRPAALHTV